MDLGKKLYELRKSKNLSQEEVADKLNVTRQTISKWETNQSTPDFDKIVPLCQLFEISTDELLTGEKSERFEKKQVVKEEKIPTKVEVRKKSAEVVSLAVFIYFVAVCFIMIAIPVLRWNPIVSSAIFLLIIAFATTKIIKHYMSIPKFEKTEEERKEDTVVKQIDDIIGGICTVIYFIVSFMTMAWHITWIIFVIYGVISQIVKLIFMLKEDKNNEE